MEIEALKQLGGGAVRFDGEGKIMAWRGVALKESQSMRAAMDRAWAELLEHRPDMKAHKHLAHEAFMYGFASGGEYEATCRDDAEKAK